jgi:hypothetical protein
VVASLLLIRERPGKISVQRPAVLTEVSRGLPQSFQVISLIVS